MTRRGRVFRTSFDLGGKGVEARPLQRFVLPWSARRGSGRGPTFCADPRPMSGAAPRTWACVEDVSSWRVRMSGPKLTGSDGTMPGQCAVSTALGLDGRLGSRLRGSFMVATIGRAVTAEALSVSNLALGSAELARRPCGAPIDSRWRLCTLSGRYGGLRSTSI